MDALAARDIMHACKQVKPTHRADFWVASRAQAPGELATDLHFVAVIYRRRGKCLHKQEFVGFNIRSSADCCRVNYVELRQLRQPHLNVCVRHPEFNSLDV